MNITVGQSGNTAAVKPSTSGAPAALNETTGLSRTGKKEFADFVGATPVIQPASAKSNAEAQAPQDTPESAATPNEGGMTRERRTEQGARAAQRDTSPSTQDAATLTVGQIASSKRVIAPSASQDERMPVNQLSIPAVRELGDSGHFLKVGEQPDLNNQPDHATITKQLIVRHTDVPVMHHLTFLAPQAIPNDGRRLTNGIPLPTGNVENPVHTSPSTKTPVMDTDPNLPPSSHDTTGTLPSAQTGQQRSGMTQGDAGLIPLAIGVQGRTITSTAAHLQEMGLPTSGNGKVLSGNGVQSRTAEPAPADVQADKTNYQAQETDRRMYGARTAESSAMLQQSSTATSTPLAKGQLQPLHPLQAISTDQINPTVIAAATGISAANVASPVFAVQQTVTGAAPMVAQNTPYLQSARPVVPTSSATQDETTANTAENHHHDLRINGGTITGANQGTHSGLTKQAKQTATASPTALTSANSGISDSFASLLTPSGGSEMTSWEPPRLQQAHPASAMPSRADMAPHIARQLVEVMGQAANRPTEIALSPEELGRVRMSVATEDGKITVNILTERPETLDLMRRHIDQLGQSFRSMGYDQVSFSFGQGAQSGDQSGSNLSADTPSGSSPTGTADDGTDTGVNIVNLDSAPTTGIDIRL